MIQILYIVAFAMALVNVFKKYIPASIVPFVSIVLAIGLNILNAFLFGGVLLDAGKEAFIQGGIAVGLFVGGDMLRQNESNPLKTKR